MANVPFTNVQILDRSGNQPYRGEVLIEEPLTQLEQEFGDRFVRIHRNCLVALAKLSGLERAADGRVLARVAGASVPLEVSRRNLPALRKLVRSL